MSWATSLSDSDNVCKTKDAILLTPSSENKHFTALKKSGYNGTPVINIDHQLSIISLQASRNNTLLNSESMFQNVFLEQPELFPCQQCGKSYHHKRTLTRHQTLECGKEPKFICTFCSYRFKHNSHLQRHIIRAHSGLLSNWTI